MKNISKYRMARTKPAVKKGRTSPKVEKTAEDTMKELVDKIKANASESTDKYIQLNDQGKKVGPGITLAGLPRIYKNSEKNDFIFVNEFRLAGPSSAVDKVLAQLGSSVSAQRLKNGLIDATNFESHLVEKEVQAKEVKPEAVYTMDKIADLAKRIKDHRVADKKPQEGSLKKKKASRTKTNTGIQTKTGPQIPVDKIPATVEAMEELLKKLAEKQLGLDVTSARLEEGVVLGCRSFRVSSKSKRIPIPYRNGHVSADGRETLEKFFGALGHSDAEVKNLLKGLPKKETVKEGKQEVKEEKGQEKGQEKDTKKGQEKDTKKGKESKTTLKPKKGGAKEKEEKPVEVSKAKTRAVKPRTSNE